MSAAWKTVRVFISSTFRDMHAERDYLVKVVFPKLRARLEQRRIHLVDVDLRWGVTKEQADNDRVLDLCLDQIDTCRPFFIGILGERYGWVPEHLPDLDESRYGAIQAMTRKSITELEIMHGVLLNPRMKRHAAFYFRDPGFIAGLDEAHREVFDEVPSADEKDRLGPSEAVRRAQERKENLAALKQETRAYCVSAPAPLYEYPCRWDAAKPSPEDGTVGRLVGLEQFGDRVEEDLWEGIAREYPGIAEAPRPPAAEGTAEWLEEEQDYHERFIESRLQVYVGRDRVHRQLLDYLQGNDTKPLLLSGGSGSGKSAILGRVFQALRDGVPGIPESALCIPHFVGASSSSTSIGAMLRRFCVALCGRFALTQTVEREGGGQETRPYEIPGDPDKLLPAFRDILRRISANERVVILVDAVNQLDEFGRGQEMYWLPLKLPPHVKVIVSCIEEDGKPQKALNNLRARKTPEVKVEPLTDEERSEIVTKVPSLSAKTLDPRQIDLLLTNPATQNPLYLIVALEELRGFGSFERLNDKIASFPCLPGEPGLNALFDQIIARLEREVGEDTVKPAFSLIACSRMGLSEQELTELLARFARRQRGEDHAGPMQVMLRQLRPYLLRRGELVDFYHRNLWKAVNQRYLEPAKPREGPEAPAETPGSDAVPHVRQRRQDWHRVLADYFNAKGVKSLRMLTETTHHLVQGAMWDELERLLTDLPYLEEKTRLVSVFDLPGEYATAVAALSSDRPLRGILELLDEAIRRDIHFIARHAQDYPQALFQSVWNHGWWYDCPDAAKHYDAPEGGWQHSPPWERTGPKLYTLLERWSADHEAFQAEARWLRSRRPPPVPLATRLKAVLRGHEKRVKSVAFSPDGARIVSGSEDKTVRLWDAASGAQLAVLRGHEFGVTSVAFSSDGARIVSGSEDKTIRLWDAASGAQLAVLRGHEFGVTSVAFSPDCTRIVSGSEGRRFSDDTVRLWDAASGAELAVLRGHEFGVTSLAFSPDGARIVTGSSDHTVRLWDAASGAELAVLRGHEKQVRSVAFNPDGTRIVSGSGNSIGKDSRTVRLWDAASGAELAVLRGHEFGVTSLAFSPDGTRIVSGSEDNTMRLWDAASGAELAVLRGHRGHVTSVAFSPDGARIVSGSWNNTVCLWDPASRAEPAVLRGHEEDVEAVAFSPDGARIVSGSGDETVRLWNASSGAELAVLRGHEKTVRCVAFSPDGNSAVSVSGDKTVRLWDAASGAELAVLRGHEFWVNSVAFSPDGDRIVTGSWDNTVRLWDAASGRALAILRGHVRGVNSVAFSPDGARIVSGSRDETVRLWNASSGAELDVLRGHRGHVTSVAFSRDGARIVSGSFDNTVRLWDASSGAELDVLRGHEKDVESVALSADGKRIVSESGDDTSRLWDARRGKCIEGTRVVSAISAGPEAFPFRALSRDGETIVEDAQTGHPVACFQEALKQPVIHPNARTWAGSMANYLYLLTLEGGEGSGKDEGQREEV